jgi:hypothetical protein
VYFVVYDPDAAPETLPRGLVTDVRLPWVS